MNSSAASNYAKYVIADGEGASLSQSNSEYWASDVPTDFPFTRRVSTFRPAIITNPSNASRDPVDSDALRFSALFSTIDRYLSSPEGSFEAVDAETGQAAERVLAFVEASGRNAPKIFSHGGDSIVFTWGQYPLSMYVTISGPDAAFLLVNEVNKIQCPTKIVSLTSPEAPDLLGYIDPAHKALQNVER